MSNPYAAPPENKETTRSKGPRIALVGIGCGGLVVILLLFFATFFATPSRQITIPTANVTATTVTPTETPTPAASDVSQ